MRDAGAQPGPRPVHSGVLDSWKEIAAYLNRTVRTVQRWEKLEGLPVHRLGHSRQATVRAYPAELDEWWAGHQVAPERKLSFSSARRRAWPVIVAAIFLATAAVLVVWTIRRPVPSLPKLRFRPVGL